MRALANERIRARTHRVRLDKRERERKRRREISRGAREHCSAKFICSH